MFQRVVIGEISPLVTAIDSHAVNTSVRAIELDYQSPPSLLVVVGNSVLSLHQNGSESVLVGDTLLANYTNGTTSRKAS